MQLIIKQILILVLMCLIVAGCATAPLSQNKDLSLAVWDIENLTPGDSSYPDIGEFLTASIISTINDSGTYTVVEREQLLLALEEIGIGTTSLVDESTRLKIGKIVGVKVMVFGGYMVIGNTMRLDIRLVEVETGKIRKASQKTVAGKELSEWLNAASIAALELIK